MKTCTKCREEKPPQQFYGEATKCKQCHLTYMHEHYLATIAYLQEFVS